MAERKCNTPVGVAKAEAEKYYAEARKFDAEARKLDADTEEQEAKAAKAKIDLDREQHKRSKELAGDEFFHRFLFDKQVSEASVKECIKQLSQWERVAGKKKVTVQLDIDSPGGSIFDGFHLIDYVNAMHARGHTINTTAYGMAASMAGVILQIGKERWMGANALMLIHEGSLGAIGDFGQVEDRVKLMELMHERILTLFEDRAKPINPKTTRAFIKRHWHRKDWWLSSGECLRLGLVDKVC